MSALLASGACLIYEGTSYKVKLNGSRILLSDVENKKAATSITRQKAEQLWFEQNPPKKGEPEAAAAASTSSASATSSTTTPELVIPSVVVTTKTKARPPRVRKTRKQAAAVVEDKVAKVRALLKEALPQTTTDAEIETVVNRVCDVFVNKTTVGGVYFIRITEIAGKPVQFFGADGKETHDYVLVKLGRADNFRSRFGQFKFKFDEVLRINGDNTMEAELKRMIPANFSRYFFPTGTTRMALLKLIGIPGNNGPTEWRVLSRKTYDALFSKAPTINSLNWRTELRLTVVEKLPEHSLTIKMGTDVGVRSNSIMVEIQ
jgi:hypothetical protein